MGVLQTLLLVAAFVVLTLLLLYTLLRGRLNMEGTEELKADVHEIEYRDEEEAQAAETFKSRLLEADPGTIHINDAIELGNDVGLSKRRARQFVDEWSERGIIGDVEINEPGPGRPKRYVGGYPD